MGRSVGNSRVCRVKSFEIQQSTRIDRIARNPYTLPVKKKGPPELQKLKRKPPHDEKENEEQMETGRAHQSLPDRREIEKPEAVTRHSEEIQQSTRIDCIARNPYTLPVKKKDLRNYRS